MPTYHTEDHLIGGKLSPITKSDATVLQPCFVYVGTGGDVAVMAAGDTVAVTLKNIPAGTLLPIKVIQVMSTNTTASDMVAVR